MSNKKTNKRRNTQTSIQNPPPKSLNQNPSLTTASVSYSGPIPPPEMLQSYEKIQPGLADRIVAMTEKSLDHSIEIDKGKLRAESDFLAINKLVLGRESLLAFFGLAGAVLIVMMFIGSAIYLFSTNEQIPGYISLGSSLFSMLGIFKLNRHRNKIVDQMESEDS